MSFVCIFELRIAFNNIKAMIVAQIRFYGNLCRRKKNKTRVSLQSTVPYIFVLF
jgi:hypothetical protein